MEQFSVKGFNGYFEIEFAQVVGFPDQTSPWGGYDVKGMFRIKVDEYSAFGELWFSTGEIYQLYQDLKNIYDTLQGTVHFNTYEYVLRTAQTNTIDDINMMTPALAFVEVKQ